MIPRLFTAALAAATLVACGGKSSAFSRNNPGTGSSTLQVKAVLDAAQGTGGYVTDMVVVVKDVIGNPVSGATVLIANGAPDWGTVTLVELSAGSGEYRAARNSFPGGDFGLSVQSAKGNVQGVVLGGPGVHGINAPTSGAIAQANVPLGLSWTTPSQALTAVITTKGNYVAATPDTGVFTIPAANNPPTANQTLNIARYNETNLAGGLSGSYMRVTVETQVNYTVQ
ncbi:MAG: hypothetical protein NVS4B10_08780 [Myxococcales bacterium]